MLFFKRNFNRNKELTQLHRNTILLLLLPKKTTIYEITLNLYQLSLHKWTKLRNFGYGKHESRNDRTRHKIMAKSWTKKLFESQVTKL